MLLEYFVSIVPYDSYAYALGPMEPSLLSKLNLIYTFSMKLKDIRNPVQHTPSVTTTNRQFQRFIQNIIKPFECCYDHLLVEVIPSDTSRETKSVRQKLSKVGFEIAGFSHLSL